MIDIITKEDATQFSNKVLERFANPYIQHKWTSIAMNFEEKMKMRNGYLMDTYATNNKVTAKYMSIGFAAFLVYMEQAHQKQIEVADYCKDALFAAEVSKWVMAIKEKGMKNILAA